MRVCLYDEEPGIVADEAQEEPVGNFAISAGQFAADVRQHRVDAGRGEGGELAGQTDDLLDLAPRRVSLLGGTDPQLDGEFEGPVGQNTATVQKGGGRGAHVGRVPRARRICRGSSTVDEAAYCEWPLFVDTSFTLLIYFICGFFAFLFSISAKQPQRSRL